MFGSKATRASAIVCQVRLLSLKIWQNKKISSPTVCQMMFLFLATCYFFPQCTRASHLVSLLVASAVMLFFNCCWMRPESARPWRFTVLLQITLSCCCSCHVLSARTMSSHLLGFVCYGIWMLGLECRCSLFFCL